MTEKRKYLLTIVNGSRNITARAMSGDRDKSLAAGTGTPVPGLADIRAGNRK